MLAVVLVDWQYWCKPITGCCATFVCRKSALASELTCFWTFASIRREKRDLADILKLIATEPPLRCEEWCKELNCRCHRRQQPCALKSKVVVVKDLRESVCRMSVNEMGRVEEFEGIARWERVELKRGCCFGVDRMESGDAKPQSRICRWVAGICHGARNSGAWGFRKLVKSRAKRCVGLRRWLADFK